MDSTREKHPAPTPEDLQAAVESIPDGPNIEADSDALKAARGEIPLTGPRAGEDASKHDAQP